MAMRIARIRRDSADEQMIAAFMTRVAALPCDPQSKDPACVWWQAQWRRRWDAEQRAQLPLDVMRYVEVAAGLGTAALLLHVAIPYVF